MEEKLGFGVRQAGLEPAAVHGPGHLSELACPHLQDIANNTPSLQGCGESITR